MQTSKARTGSSEVPQKTSPGPHRTARQLKLPAPDSDSVSSSHPVIRTSKDRSPKVNERRSPRSPMAEKKRPSRVSELESQFSQLQEDLKKAKEQLSSSESWKRRAQQEAEDAKKQLSAMSSKLEESQQQLLDLSASEEARVQELRKISQDRDRAWESELEAVQKQSSIDSAALASAMNEIHKLKKQLEMGADFEASQTKYAESAHAEIQSLRQELAESFSMVEKLKTQLNNCKESEAQALEVLSNTQNQLEMAKETAETLRSNGFNDTDAYNSLVLELEQSKARANSLEELVSQLQADLVSSDKKNSANPTVQLLGETEETNQLKVELNLVRFEASQLRSALEAAEMRYQEVCIQTTLQISSAIEQMKRTESVSCAREAELEAEIKKAKASIEELNAKLMDKETELQNILEENEVLNSKMEKTESSDKESKLETMLKKSEADLEELKASLLDKETELQNIIDENEDLKLEITKKEMEKNKASEESVALEEAERDALMKVGYLTEEADKNSRRAERMSEQLDAAQAANSEMEAEMRRLKVQSDQWRKAAEAAAAMLSSGNNGKFVERTGSLDSNYHTIGGKMGSPYSDDMDDDSPKKKNGNMLKKIGGLWKKGQK